MLIMVISSYRVERWSGFTAPFPIWTLFEHTNTHTQTVSGVLTLTSELVAAGLQVTCVGWTSLAGGPSYRLRLSFLSFFNLILHRSLSFLLSSLCFKFVSLIQTPLQLIFADGTRFQFSHVFKGRADLHPVMQPLSLPHIVRPYSPGN